MVGLDGVPITLLQRLAGRGVMPHTAKMLAAGHLRQMRAALPPVSSVSWSSFMTGANPGEHGIFGFTDVGPESYRLQFPFFSDLSVPTFWDRLGEAGLRCAIINQPATYPARAVPGVLVSGFVAPRLSKSVWPRQHLPMLDDMGYRIDVETEGAGDNPDRLLGDLLGTLETRQRAAQYFWELEDWDYFQVVVTETDRLHHFLWQAVEREDNPFHERAMDCYRAIDGLIAEFWDLFHRRRSGSREGEGFLLLSDHGFCGVRQEVCLNAWLRDNGYLEYKTDAPESVADLAPTSRAFALDPGRIYVNRKGRFAQGCVEEEEVAALAEELARRAAALSFEGEQVMEKVLPRDSVYHGGRTHLGPDLVCLGRPGFDLKGTTKSKEVFRDSRFQGMHTWDDALVWSSLPLPDDPEISGLAGVIVEWLSA